MWKKSLALILIMCLIVGFTQDGRLYARTEENALGEAVAQAVEQDAEEQTVEEDTVSEETEETEETEESQTEETPIEESGPEEVKEIPAEEPQPEETEKTQTEETQPQTPADTPTDAEGETVQQAEEPNTVEENFEPTMSIATLNNMAANSSSVVDNETVNVKIYNNDVVTDGTIRTGLISENVEQTTGNSHFVGAYVVLETGEEDEIAYIGSYSDDSGNVHIYYAFSEDITTGILLKEGQYIKLVYKTTCKITYQIQLEDGTICENGGTFYNKQESADYGTNVRIQFKASKGNAEIGDCTLISVKAIGADGTETSIATDEDGYGYLKSITQDVTICAQVSIVNQYKLVVDKQTGGHVCWGGYGKETGSNTKDPYSVSPNKFCSYRTNADGTVDTVTAAPGGTIYFVLYSQAWSGGGVWELRSLKINGKPVDPIYNGKEYTTDLGNGMIAHFKYLGGGTDSHLAPVQTGTTLLGRPTYDYPASKERCKYECWVENVSEDIHVEFESFDSTNHEIVTLAEANGVESVCASTFDRQAVGGAYLGIGKNVILPAVGHYDFWFNLYNPVNVVGKDITDVKYEGNGLSPNPDSPYAISFWGAWEFCWFYSDHAHVEMESDVFAVPGASKETSQWGSRYIYFKTKPGYDPRSLDGEITGQGADGSGRIKVDEIDNIANLASTKISTLFYNAQNNTSLKKAKERGYEWYVYYKGCGINVRNLYLNCEPYQFGVEYDLDGGTIDGSDVYTDTNKYTIESGKNKISLPNTVPTKEGMVFEGWKLVPINGGYTSDGDALYDTNGVFTINSKNYEAALETEKIEYELPDDNYDMVKFTDYSPISGGNHRFRFVAQWAEAGDPTAPKAEYTVKVYTETAPGTEDAVEVDGRTYTFQEKTYLGTKGETIISIQNTPEGYVLDKEKSVTKLENFMRDGNTDNEIVYYFNTPEFSLDQSTNPEGGASQEEATKVKTGDEICYTLVVKNEESTKVVLPEGTVITEVLPEGMGTPESQKDGGLEFSYDEKTRTITYTVTSPIELAKEESIVLQYITKVETGGLMENQAQMQVDWKSYESEKSYHVTSADLVISNVLRGDYADYSKSFSVKVTLTKADGEPLDDKRVSYEGGKLNVNGANGAPGNGTKILNAQNEITLNLKHGQTITLKDLPYGCVYSVVQKEESGYTTSYGGVATGEFFQGTDIPIVTEIWPEADDFADEYAQLTLAPSGIFKYDGEYYVICREYQLNREQAEIGPGGKGPDGTTNSWYGVTKLSGKIVEMEKGAESINGLSRGDIVKYENNYYVFNTDGEWGCNPENDTANPPQYYRLPQSGAQSELLGDTTVSIFNFCQKVSPTGVNETNPYRMGGYVVVAFAALFAAGFGIKRKKNKKSM